MIKTSTDVTKTDYLKESNVFAIKGKQKHLVCFQAKSQVWYGKVKRKHTSLDSIIYVKNKGGSRRPGCRNKERIQRWALSATCFPVLSWGRLLFYQDDLLPRLLHWEWSLPCYALGEMWTQLAMFFCSTWTEILEWVRGSFLSVDDPEFQQLRAWFFPPCT